MNGLPEMLRVALQTGQNKKAGNFPAILPAR